MTNVALPNDEQRAAVRTRSLLRANIVFNNRLSTLDCVVRNLSATGARLQMSHGHLAPDEFDIHFPQRRETRRARTAWRGDDGIGISFLNAGEHSRPESLSDRTRALAVENEELRHTIRDLKRRLAEATRAVDASY